MKINAFRRFFTEDYKDVPPGGWFSALLSNLNQFTDPVITALRNGLTFEDNFRCQIKTLPFHSMVEVQIGTNFSSPPTGVTAIFVDGAMLLGTQYRPIKSGVIGVTLKLSDELAHDVRLVIYQ